MVTIHCMDSSGTSRKKKREEYSEPSKTPSSIHTPCTFHAVGELQMYIPALSCACSLTAIIMYTRLYSGGHKCIDNIISLYSCICISASRSSDASIWEYTGEQTHK